MYSPSCGIILTSLSTLCWGEQLSPPMFFALFRQSMLFIPRPTAATDRCSPHTGRWPERCLGRQRLGRLLRRQRVKGLEDLALELTAVAGGRRRPHRVEGEVQHLGTRRVHQPGGPQHRGSQTPFKPPTERGQEIRWVLCSGKGSGYHAKIVGESLAIRII